MFITKNESWLRRLHSPQTVQNTSAVFLNESRWVLTSGAAGWFKSHSHIKCLIFFFVVTTKFSLWWFLLLIWTEKQHQGVKKLFVVCWHGENLETSFNFSDSKQTKELFYPDLSLKAEDEFSAAQLWNLSVEFESAQMFMKTLILLHNIIQYFTNWIFLTLVWCRTLLLFSVIDLKL